MPPPNTGQPAAPPTLPEKKPEQAKGAPAPKPTPVVNPVPVQFFAARLFARHIAAAGSDYSFVGDVLSVSETSKIALSYGVSEAAVFVKLLLADKDFVVVKTTVGAGRARREIETLAKLNGQITLKVGESAKYGFVHRKVETVTEGKKQVKKVVETAPAESITLDFVNGETKIGKPGDGVYVLKAKAAANLDPANLPADKPGPDTTITIEFGKLTDEKKKELSDKQRGAECTAPGAAVKWAVTSRKGVDPEVAHRKYKSDDSLDGLYEHFGANVKAFFDTLKSLSANGAKLVPSIPLNTVYRCPQHAYLFCWAKRVGNGTTSPDAVPAYKDQDGLADPTFPEIDWRLARPYGARHFGTNPTAEYDPPGKTTNHLRRLAVDCNINLNVTAKTELTVKVPATYSVIELKRAANGALVPERTKEVQNDPSGKEVEVKITLEPVAGANGWIDVTDAETQVTQIAGGQSDKRTYRAGNVKESDFVIDVSGVGLTAAEKDKVKNDAEKEVRDRHETALASEVEAAANKEIARQESARKRAKKPALTDAEKQSIRDKIEKPLRDKHEKAITKETDQLAKSRIAAQEAERKEAERKKQYDEKAPQAQAKAKTAAENKRKANGNYWQALHRLGEQYFGVKHFRNHLQDPPHWSYNGG